MVAIRILKYCMDFFYSDNPLVCVEKVCKLFTIHFHLAPLG